MTEAQKILEMIEAVDPADTSKLDEIDDAVMSYLYIQDIKEYAPPCIVEMIEVTPQQFTRSRDALKGIWPEGWELTISTIDGSAVMYRSPDGIETFEVSAFHFPTEELAELHVIIQAIEFERSRK